MEARQETDTIKDQQDLELKVHRIYRQYCLLPAEQRLQCLQLTREAHVAYLHTGLKDLPAGFIALDASRPWIAYWVLHALALLDAPLPEDVRCTVLSLSRLRRSLCTFVLSRRSRLPTLLSFWRCVSTRAAGMAVGHGSWRTSRPHTPPFAR
jgi:hypothetical protein